MKTGIIDVGGGLRGIYAAGILDRFLENNVSFDLGIGVSAGSANLAAFGARQHRRNFQFYTEFSMRKEYMGMANFLLHHSFVDLDYVYSTLSNSTGEYPLDYPTLRDNPMEFLVVATDARTGLPRYFDKSDISQDQYHVCKASSAIPFVCAPYFIDGVPYYDGALGDPVPVEKAFAWGCDRVVLILSRPEDTIRNNRKDSRMARGIEHKYPMAAEAFRERAELYNRSVDLAKKYRKEGRVFILSPDDTCGVDTLSRNKEDLERLYLKGWEDGAKAFPFLGIDPAGPAK